MKTNEILNNTASAASSFDDALAALVAETEKEMESLGDTREAKKKERRETLFNDTNLALVLASRGYLGITAWKLNESPVAPKIAKMPCSSKSAVIAGITMTVSAALNDGRKHLTIYAQDTEVRRVAGMLARIKAGDNIVLTEKENEFVLRFRDMGEQYVTYCKGLFGQLKKAHEAGISVKMVSIDQINSTPLKNKNLPLELAGRKVRFTNGTARIQSNILTMDGMSLSGEFELTVYNGRLAVKRDLTAPDAKERMPEAYYAGMMLTVTSRRIAKAVEENGTEDAEEAAA